MENMSGGNLTAGDVLALTRGNDGNGFGFGGVGGFVLLFIFLLAISGNGFFGGNGNVNQMATADLLYKTLEFVNLDEKNMVCGSNMNYEFKDGFLHFYVTYSLTMQRQNDEENMGNILYRSKSKSISGLI